MAWTKSPEITETFAAAQILSDSQLLCVQGLLALSLSCFYRRGEVGVCVMEIVRHGPRGRKLGHGDTEILFFLPSPGFLVADL